MCGICGFITDKTIPKEALIKMNNSLAHRGPDDHGEEIYQIDHNICVGFAHRRLSIMDLSDKGHQPMHSPDQRVSVIFNGEIYNHRELRKEITEYPFCSECDTEIIIAAYLKWGMDFVEKINGMFAIALLDREDGTVYLIRDRIGKKPVYYHLDMNNNVVFASELKALFHSGIFRAEINRNVIGRFLYQNYIIAPDTIYQNTYKLEAGTVLKISKKKVEKYKYWDVADRYNVLKQDSIQDYVRAKRELKEILKRAVARRMIADVPIGAFLSGGYDSSLVCALAQECSGEPIKTFAIGFEDSAYNEAPYAKEVANVLGTDHTELYIAEKELLDILDSIPDYYDEPMADSSQIATMYVAELAKKDVSVVLSGDGGDELFGGYGIYPILQQVQKKWYLGRLLYQIGKLPHMKETRLWKKRTIIYRVLSDDNNREAKTQAGVNSYFDIVNKILGYRVDNFYYETESRYQEKRLDITRMLLDVDTYLPEDILAKVDRATMRYALECRCPILDPEVVEYSFRISPNFKVDHGTTKKILRDIVYEYIPRTIMERPKAGFAVPIDRWMRSALKDKIMDWSSKDYLDRQGIFDADATQNFINTYIKEGDGTKWSGRNYSRIAWAYYIFQQWYERYMEKGYQ